MIDFNKEELEQMLEDVRINQAEDCSEFFNKLTLKLKYMIDNYCEHKHILQDAIYPDLCTDCNKGLRKNLI